MKVRTWAVPASLALLLSACVVPMYSDDGGSHRSHQHRHHEREHNDDASRRSDRMPQREEGRRNHQRSSRFSCRNGLSVTVRLESADRLSLRLDDKYALLEQVVSGSGERYASDRGLFGSGAEWHQKGDEANFSFKDPYGNRVETTCHRR